MSRPIERQTESQSRIATNWGLIKRSIRLRDVIDASIEKGIVSMEQWMTWKLIREEDRMEEFLHCLSQKKEDVLDRFSDILREQNHKELANALASNKHKETINDGARRENPTNRREETLSGASSTSHGPPETGISNYLLEQMNKTLIDIQREREEDRVRREEDRAHMIQMAEKIDSIATSKAEIDDAKQKARELEIQNTELNTTIEDMNREIIDFRAKAADLDEHKIKVDDQEKLISKLKEQIEEMSVKNKNIEDKCEKLQSKFNNFVKEYSKIMKTEIKFENIPSHFKIYKAETTEENKNISASRDQYLREKREIEERYCKMEKDLRTVQENKDKLEKELKQLQNRIKLSSDMQEKKTKRGQDPPPFTSFKT